MSVAIQSQDLSNPSIINNFKICSVEMNEKRQVNMMVDFFYDNKYVCFKMVSLKPEQISQLNNFVIENLGLTKVPGSQ